MSAFEFFFSFYGLLLGLSVAELVGGFSRILHERHRVRFGWLTPLLALFVALDLATFWNQAWRFFRGAPFNPALLLVGLVIAATFYVAASLTFPRVTAEGVEQRIDLDAHFWAHRRVVFGCILAANALVWILLGLLAMADPAWGALWTPRLAFGVSLFALGTAAAAFAPWRGVVVAALLVLLAYTLWNMLRAGAGLSPPGPGCPRPADEACHIDAFARRRRMRTLPILAALAALSCSVTPAMSQNSEARAVSNATPWDQPFLPPAPEWNGRSRALLADPSDPLATSFERDPAHDVSPNYADTRAWFDNLAAESDLIRIEEFGVSPEGRPIYAVIASKDDVFDPAKTVLLAQAGIHPGEIDGKDAGMMLMRDIALGGSHGLLDFTNFILIPILSVDGHERASAYSRPNQRGPRIQGWRHTATNQNLNRDFMKLDQPEMRAVMGLIRKYQPDLYVDIHVTDGMDYQYDVTYGYNGEDGIYSRSPATAAWLDEFFKPSIDSALENQGHIPGPLVFGVDDADPKKGLSDGGLGERFSNGWGSAAHVPTILIENHSLKPYEQRVLGTYVFLRESLRVLGELGAGLQTAIEADKALRPAEIPANFQPDPTPTGTRAFKGIAYEMYDSPASGRPEIRWLGTPDPEPWSLPFFGSRPTLTLKRPVAYWVPGYRTDLIERLRLQGLEMETLDAPRTVAVDMLRLNDPKIAARTNEAHVQIAVTEVTTEPHDWTWPIGSVRVPTDQPMGEVAVLLLEPQSSESFFAWGMVPEVLNRVEYIEGYAIAPLAERMLAADPALKAEFEAKIAADPAFAADGDARLAWFYERTPFYDNRYRLYPVGREN